MQFNFLVDFGTGDAQGPDAGFQECSPISMEIAVAEYRNGNDKENNSRKITGLGTRSYGQVTLRRGMTATFDLWDWVDAFLGADQKRLRNDLRSDAEVVLLAPDGKTERARFLLRRCLPILLKAPTLNAKDGKSEARNHREAATDSISRTDSIGAGGGPDPDSVSFPHQAAVVGLQRVGLRDPD
jgi:phage tail-like protein